MLVQCQAAYQVFYTLNADAGGDVSNLPIPKPMGAILASIRILMSDNAANETGRENLIEEMVSHLTPLSLPSPHCQLHADWSAGGEA